MILCSAPHQELEWYCPIAIAVNSQDIIAITYNGPNLHILPVSVRRQEVSDFFIHDYWVSGLFPRSGILNTRTREDNVSDTGSVSILRWWERFMGKNWHLQFHYTSTPCMFHHPVPGGYKYGDLALQVEGVSNETEKYGRESYGTLSREWLLWQGQEAIVWVNYWPILSSERVPHIKKPAIVRKKTKIWS
jgi:hypothetical protein